MRLFTLRDWLVISLIGLAVLYTLDHRIVSQPERIQQLIVSLATKLLVIGFSITVHEFGHAAVANLLGDFTPRQEGRVSLNPIRHLDPLGTLMILIGPIGWGKPVRWNPGNIQKTNIRVAIVAVSLAGICMNLLLALLALKIYKYSGFNLSPEFDRILIGDRDGRMPGFWQMNIMLAAFNILPIPPLDGYNFWLGVLPPTLARWLFPLNQYGFLILVALIVLPSIGGPDVLSALVDPVQSSFGRLVSGFA